MSEIEVFQFPATGDEIRTALIDGEAWVVARDVCTALGIVNGRDAVARLDEDGVGTTDVIDSMGRTQRAAVVNEAGLYELIFQSRRPEARAFRRWVTHEVLPTIRKTGSYGAPAIPDMSTAEGRLQILDMAVKAERRALEAETRVKELEPDAARARATLDADGMALVGTVAKRFGIKERALREFLFAEGLLIRAGARRNEPYAAYVQSGHFALKTRLVGDDPDRPPVERSTTFVTPKGEALIWKRLFDAGYVTSPRMPQQQLALI